VGVPPATKLVFAQRLRAYLRLDRAPRQRTRLNLSRFGCVAKTVRFSIGTNPLVRESYELCEWPRDLARNTLHPATTLLADLYDDHSIAKSA
jgi:hypothetical protein